jgi:hypothetical protein
MDEYNERRVISKLNSSTFTEEQKMILLGEVKLKVKAAPVKEPVILP